MLGARLASSSTSGVVAPDVDAEWLAAATPGWVGADLAALVYLFFSQRRKFEDPFKI